MSDTHIVRRSLNDRRKGKTDWDKVERQTDEEIAANVAADPDAAPLLDQDWIARAETISRGKKLISIRLDQDVIDFFRSNGKNYQTRMNAVLRAYVEAHRHR